MHAKKYVAPHFHIDHDEHFFFRCHLLSSSSQSFRWNHFNVGILFQYSDEGSTFLFMSCDVCLFLSYIFETFFQNSSTFRWILSTIYDTLTKTTTQNNVHRTLNFFSWTENGKKNSNCRTFFLRNIVFHFSTQFEKNLPSPIQMRLFNKFLDNFMTFRI